MTMRRRIVGQPSERATRGDEHVRALPRSALVALAVGLLAPAAALACDNVYGIPTEARIRLVWLDPATPNGAPTTVAEGTCVGRSRSAAATISRDGGAIAAWHPDGFEVHFGGRTRLAKVPGPWPQQPFPGGLEWAPDGRRLAFVHAAPGGGRTLAVLDVRRLGDEEPLVRVHSPAPAAAPLGLQWDPDGEALLALEVHHAAAGDARTSVIRRVPLDGGPTAVVVERDGEVDFFVTRAHHGRASGTPAVALLFGAPDGLWIVDGAGATRRLEGVPSVGINAVDWHPSRDLVALHYRRPVADPTGRVWQGLWLVDLARPERSALVDDHMAISSVWFSPRGTWLAWSTPDGLCYRGVDDDPAATVRARPPGPDPELRGCAWSQDEARLAWCVGTRVLVRDLASGEERVVADDLLRAAGPTPAPQGGAAPTGFAGRPHWVGDRLLVTLFEDVGTPFARPAPGSPPARPAPGSPPRRSDGTEVRPPGAER